MATTPRGGWLAIPVAGVTATTGGAIVSQANPENASLIVTRAVLHRTTKSTGAANADIGIGSSATTSYDNLLDGVDVGAAEGAEDNVDEQGTNGLSTMLWPAAHFLTMTGSASTAGLVGTLYVQYIRAAAPS